MERHIGIHVVLSCRLAVMELQPGTIGLCNKSKEGKMTSLSVVTLQPTLNVSAIVWACIFGKAIIANLWH